jgi:hypothetical protein
MGTQISRRCCSDGSLDLQLAGKYDLQKEEELRRWIQDVIGKRVPDPFMESLKDGVILCE